MMPRIYIITGATATGKTAFSIELAEAVHGEILSADSRQVYREMCIGTARPSKEELARVPHHFIGDRSISEGYTAIAFAQEAKSRIQALLADGKNCIVVGGSGLYIQALLYGQDDIPLPNPDIRQTLRHRLEVEGMSSLQRELRSLDPQGVEQLDMENPRRVLRALEVCLTTGKPWSHFHQERRLKILDELGEGTRLHHMHLALPRSLLYERINARVDRMVEAGLVAEARSLLAYRNLTAMDTVGYRELFQHFDGQLSLEEAIEKIKVNSRRYAKRQETWFRKELASTY